MSVRNDRLAVAIAATAFSVALGAACSSDPAAGATATATGAGGGSPGACDPATKPHGDCFSSCSCVDGTWQCASGSCGGAAQTTSDAGGATCPDDLARAANDEVCASIAATTDCSRVTPAYVGRVCGVPVGEPPGELERASAVKRYAGAGPADVACFEKAKWPAAAGAPQAVKLAGVARVFSHGCESKGVTVEAFRVIRSGGADEGGLGALVGATTTPSDCVATGVATEEPAQCGTRYECRFEIAGVPTETELVLKTSGASWAAVYEYGVFLPNAAVAGGVATRDVTAFAADDFAILPQAGIGTSIPPGHGALVGEVHDCGDVRVANAVADVDVKKAATVYFTDDEASPMPDPGGHPHGTSHLGLFAVLDVAPGPVAVASAGKTSGALVTLGFERVRVFPDSVTRVVFRGVAPWQLPE